jgi:hypothetical protein
VVTVLAVTSVSDVLLSLAFAAVAIALLVPRLRARVLAKTIAQRAEMGLPTWHWAERLAMVVMAVVFAVLSALFALK